MKTCTHCNTQNPDDAFFCEKCGALLEETEAAVSVPVSTSIPTVAPVSIPTADTVSKPKAGWRRNCLMLVIVVFGCIMSGLRIPWIGIPIAIGDAVYIWVCKKFSYGKLIKFFITYMAVAATVVPFALR